MSTGQQPDLESRCRWWKGRAQRSRPSLIPHNSKPESRSCCLGSFFVAFPRLSGRTYNPRSFVGEHSSSRTKRIAADPLRQTASRSINAFPPQGRTGSRPPCRRAKRPSVTSLRCTKTPMDFRRVKSFIFRLTGKASGASSKINVRHKKVAKLVAVLAGQTVRHFEKAIELVAEFLRGDASHVAARYKVVAPQPKCHFPPCGWLAAVYVTYRLSENSAPQARFFGEFLNWAYQEA